MSDMTVADTKNDPPKSIRDSNGKLFLYEEQPPFKCRCGFRGRVVDLVAPDDDNDPIECPKCHGGNWEWI